MRRLLINATLAVAAFVPFAALAAPPETIDMQNDEFFQILDDDSIRYFTDQGVLGRSMDGSIHLASNITRIELVKAVVEYVYPKQAISRRCLSTLDTDRFPGVSYTHLFRDVRKDAAYALELCAAMRGGIVWGYGDGNFRPDRNVNLAEAAKIISIAFNLDYTMPMYQTNDWYMTYLKTINEYAVLPTTIKGPAHSLRVGEVRQMLVSVNSRAAYAHGSHVDRKLDTIFVGTTRVQHVSTNAAQDVMMAYD